MKSTHTALAATAKLWDDMHLNGYSDDCNAVKQKAHAAAKKILRDFAVDVLGLNTKQFEVRSNMAGIAVSGEVTLYTDAFGDDGKGIYIQVGQSSLGRGHSIMFRTMKHRKDYTGGHNNFRSFRDALGSPSACREFGETIKSLVNRMILH
jgi:hypothetical protein